METNKAALSYSNLKKKSQVTYQKIDFLKLSEKYENEQFELKVQIYKFITRLQGKYRSQNCSAQKNTVTKNLLDV